MFCSATGEALTRFGIYKIVVNTFHVAYDEDRDDVTPIITRAMALLAENGRALPAGDVDNELPDSTVDHLADLHDVLRGEVRVRTQKVLRRLAELNPDEYGGWSFQQLADVLAEFGITARKYQGTMNVRSADVAKALAERDDNDGDDDV